MLARFLGRLPFKVVSFYTTRTPYEDHARRLVASLKRFGLPFDVDAVEPAAYWEWNCAKKPGFIRQKLSHSRCPVVWLDADATVEAFPNLFAEAGADFGVHKWNDHHFGSGTLYFSKSVNAEALLAEWERRCEADPTTWDQTHLERSWSELYSRGTLSTLLLPRSYLQIFDQPEYAPPVIKHWQASRLEKRSGRALVPYADGDARPTDRLGSAA